MTAIMRGRIRDGAWVDSEMIYEPDPRFFTGRGQHFGTRIVFRDGYLFFPIGDRGAKEQAQNLSRPSGKHHRIFDDGRIPEDNPFQDKPNALPTLWTYGNRNPQGLAIHPQTGNIWSAEHGPRGGDEVNLIERGTNYGWPVITYGMNYNGTPMTDRTSAPGMAQPELYWTPSIAVCGIDFYSGKRFPGWQDNLFAGGLASEEVHRLVIEDREIVHQEIILKGAGRVRDVKNGGDGYLYLVLNGPGRIVRLVPAHGDR
jgi:glucose/arabinose dehydrogenase